VVNAVLSILPLRIAGRTVNAINAAKYQIGNAADPSGHVPGNRRAFFARVRINDFDFGGAGDCVHRSRVLYESLHSPHDIVYAAVAALEHLALLLCRRNSGIMR